MARVRTKHTLPELTLRSLIHRLGYRFRLHRSDLPGKPDLVFPSRKKVIFVHGCFWHGHHCRRGKTPTSHVAFWTRKIETNRNRDVRTLDALRMLGWKTMVVWECELKNRERLTKAITRFLSGQAR